MIDISFIIQRLASAIVGGLFPTEKFKNEVGKQKRDFFKRSIVESVRESITTHYSEEFTIDQANLLAQNLLLIFEKIDLTPESRAKYAFDIDKLLDHYFSSDSVQRELLDDQLEMQLRKIARKTCLDIMQWESHTPPLWEQVIHQNSDKKFDAINEKLNVLNNIAKLVSHEDDYLRHIVPKLRRIRLEGVGNIQDVNSLSLETIFIDLSLRKIRLESSNKITLNNINTALNESTLIVIQGRPGSGKSTLAQFLALNAAMGTIKISDVEKKLIPFLFKVREFKDFDKLPVPDDFCTLCAEMLPKSEGQNLAPTVLREKRGLILVDGLDECEIKTNQKYAKSEHDKVISWLKYINELFPGNCIVVTSRPVKNTVVNLNESNFVAYDIMPLTPKQQQNFVSQWYRSVELSINPDEQKKSFDTADKKAKNLNSSIESNKLVTVLAETPLMLTVICILHRSGGEHLSGRKLKMLNDCLDVLLYNWQLSKGLKESLIGDLDAEQLKSLLQPVAWKMLLDGQEQIAEADLRSAFLENLPKLNKPVERAGDIINTIRDRTGVLLEASPGIYEFSHLSFQDYLAAKEYAEIRDDQLLSHVDNPRWKEFIPMAVALCSNSYDTMISALLGKGKDILAAKALEMIVKLPVDLRESVKVALNKIPERMKLKFDKDLLSSLIEIGSLESTQVLFKIVLEFPTVTSTVFFDFIASYEFENTEAFTVSTLAERTLDRCLFADEVDLGGVEWKTIRPIGYFNEDNLGKRNGFGSWDCLNLGIAIGNENPNGDTESIAADAIYNYASLLDTCDLYRSHLRNLVWPAFEVEVANKSPSEKSLLVLHVAWYLAVAEDHVCSLFSYLETFPVEICPAFQIGLINNAMSRLRPDIADNVKNQAERLWKARANEIKRQISNLIKAWNGGITLGTVENPQPAPANELAQCFEELLYERIKSARPFIENSEAR